MRLFMSALAVILFAVHVAAQCDPPPPPIDEDWCSYDCSPIVINFAHETYRLSGAESPVAFDIRATGQPVRMGWTAPGADEAFLCLDRNHNGTIDSGAELFGNSVLMDDRRHARNGFVALAQYDDDRNAVIDERDPVWSQLLLWRDLNHDGISQSGELAPVAGSRLAAIGLDYHWTGRRDSSGNTFRYEAQVSLSDGAGHVYRRPLYDIFFVLYP
jgi:hypothetical protein